MPLVFEDNKTKQNISLQSVSSVITAGVVSCRLPSCQHLKYLTKKDKEKELAIFILSILERWSEMNSAVLALWKLLVQMCPCFLVLVLLKSGLDRGAKVPTRELRQLFCQDNTCPLDCCFSLMRISCIHYSCPHYLCLALSRKCLFYTYLLCLSICQGTI